MAPDLAEQHWRKSFQWCASDMLDMLEAHLMSYLPIFCSTYLTVIPVLLRSHRGFIDDISTAISLQRLLGAQVWSGQEACGGYCQ